MRKFLIRLLLFSIVFFLLDKLFYVFLLVSPTLEVDKRLELLLEGKINKEVIIMGSSRGAYNIIASQIEKETSLTAYNIAYPGSNIEFHEFLLKTLLKYNKKPKIIIVSIDDPAEFLYDKTLNFRLDRLYPLVKYNYINQELINQNDKNYLSHFMCLARLNKSNFNLTKKNNEIKSPILACGSMPFIDTLNNKNFAFQSIRSNYNRNEEIASKKKAFKEFQDICSKKNIKIIYCFAPNFKTYDEQLENRIGNSSSVKKQIFVYDTTNVIYKNINYFYDESHLNIKGAKIFTSELSNYINSIKK